jgi:hypothetical protein
LKTTLKITAILLFLVSILSCRTSPYETAEVTAVKQLADVTLTLTYLSEEDLIQLEGKPFRPTDTAMERTGYNPYILPSKGIFQRELLVFRLHAVSEETVLRFTLTDICLTMGGVVDSAKNINRLMVHWDGFLDDSEDTFMRESAMRTLLPYDCIVAPGEPLEGYLVFFKNFPKTGGDAVISIPAETDSGDSGVIEIEFEFYDPKYSGNDGIFVGDEEGGDSGIFDEDQPADDPDSEQTDSVPE